MPIVLNTASIINHIGLFFLAAFHNAISFQTPDQSNKIITNQVGIPKVVEISEVISPAIFNLF